MHYPNIRFMFLNLCEYTCVMCEHVCGGTCVPQYACGCQRTTFVVHQYLLPCFRQGLFFPSVYASLTGLHTSRGSHAFTSHFYLGALELQILLSCPDFVKIPGIWSYVFIPVSKHFIQKFILPVFRNLYIGSTLNWVWLSDSD